MTENRLRVASLHQCGAVLWLCGLMLAGPALAVAQQSQPSLADLARKEQERRNAIKVASKVYSDKDIKPSDARPAPAEGAAVAPTPVAESPAGGAAGKNPDDGTAGKDKTWWKGRIDQTREDLRRNQAFAEALQTKINALTTDYVNRDDPAQRAKIGEDRQKSLAEMERVKGEIERLTKQIGTIEEEARKAGVPPGWLR